MFIHINNLKFKTIIGILDFERITPQEVTLDITISYHYKDIFINYVDVVEMIKTDMQIQKYQLIEEALIAISQLLKDKFKQIVSIDIKIAKPTILKDCEVGASEKFIF